MIEAYEKKKLTPLIPGYFVKTFFSFARCHDNIPSLRCSNARGATLKCLIHNFNQFIQTVLKSKAIYPDC